MEQKRLATGFFKNSFYQFLFSIISHFGGVVFTILIARILNPELFGTYTLTLSIVLTLMTLGGLGINEAVIMYISSNYKNKKKVRAYFIYFFKIKIIISLFLSLILILLSRIIASFYNQKSMSVILIFGALYLFFYSLMQFISCLFYAFKNVKAYVYKEFVFQAIRLSLIPFLIIFSVGFLVEGTFMLSVIGSIIAAFFSIIYLFKKYRLFFNQTGGQINKKEVFNFMKYLSFSSLSLLFLVYTDILILGKFVDPEFVGFYKTVSSVVLLAASLLMFNPILSPIFTQINKRRTKNTLNILLYYLFIFSIPITIGLIIFGSYFIKLLFGAAYLPSVLPLYSLVLLVIFLPAEELFRSLFVAKKESKIVAKIISISAIVDIILNFALIYYFLRFGAIYAAFAAGITTVFSKFIVFFMLAKASKSRFNIKIKPSIIIKPAIASLIMGGFLIVFTKVIFKNPNLLIVILEIILAIGIYFLSLYLIKGISKKETNYIKKIIYEVIKNKSFINSKES